MSTVTRSILKGDKIRCKDGKAIKYGTTEDQVFTVSLIDEVQGRKRLYCHTPERSFMFWSGDCKLAWGAASKERIEGLGL